MAASEHEPGNGRRPLSGKSLSWREQWILAGLLVFTLVVRGSVLWFMRGNLEQDPDAYREIAENLIVHGEFALGNPQAGDWHPRPTAYRPPLYPVVLSNLPAADRQHVSLFKVAVLHLVLGVATVWLTWETARRIGFSQESAALVGTAHPTETSIRPPGNIWRSLVAGFIVACDPILLNQQTLVMTETLAAFLAVLSLWCLARFDGVRTPFNAAITGGAIGLAVLCRPTFLPWLGLVAGTMVLMRGRNSEFRIQNSEFRWLADVGWRVANVAGLLLVAVAVVSPWAIRNYRIFGKPIVTTTHGGYTFLLANNGYFFYWFDHDQSGIPWSAHELDEDLDNITDGYTKIDATGRVRNLSELGRDQYHYDVAWDFIRRQPRVFVKTCFFRLWQLWSPLPHKLMAVESMRQRCLRYATCAWYCGVYLLAVIGVWRLRWKLMSPPWICGVLLCVAFMTVHTLYWTNLRMRAPLMPFVAIVAAYAASSRFNVQSR